MLHVRDQTPQSTDHIWRSLRRFENVEYTAKRIIEKHKLSKKQHENARKQALQIRYSLNQAEEYFRAAKSVSIATKPLLLYYGVMSLAIAEVLYKQDGLSSIDMARKKHSHHGLTFSVSSSTKANEPLSQSAVKIRSAPLKVGGEYFGTFELWHRSSREYPVVGTSEVHYQSGGTTKTSGILFTADTKTRPKLADGGVTFLDCIRSLPSMRPVMAELGDRCDLVRATSRMEYYEETKKIRYDLIFHDRRSDYDAFLSKFIFSLDFVPLIQTVKFPGAYAFSWESTANEFGSHCAFPMASQLDANIVYFHVERDELNEFGLYYVGMHALGNFVRYYPDHWMQDVEKSSDLAVAVHAFAEAAELRCPLLTLSELTETFHVH